MHFDSNHPSQHEGQIQTKLIGSHRSEPPVLLQVLTAAERRPLSASASCWPSTTSSAAAPPAPSSPARPQARPEARQEARGSRDSSVRNAETLWRFDSGTLHYASLGSLISLCVCVYIYIYMALTTGKSRRNTTRAIHPLQ